MNTNGRKKTSAEYFRNLRASRKPEERSADANRRKRKRASLTPDEQEARNLSRREYRRRRLDLNEDIRSNEATRQRRLRIPSKSVARNPEVRPPLHDLKRQSSVCQSCNAMHFEAEKTYRGKFAGCCGSGSVVLPPLKEYPDQLLAWLTESNEEGKNFRANIRKYNSAFAFASFGYQPVRFSHGPQAFVIHGQVYHKTAQTLNSSVKPVFAQLYILDPEFANQERLTNECNVGCREDILTKISSIILDINPYANAYTMMKDLMKESGNNETSVTMWITKDRQHDPRRYNLPIANEVAAVFISEDGEPPFDRDIAVHPRSGTGLQNISIISPNCDPMVYPLLFPYGEPGYQRGITKICTTSNSVETAETSDNDENGEEKTRNVSMLEFYSYRLQERDIFNPLLHAGKLTQQFIVDAFLKVEAQRLQWNQLNQKKLRVDLYMGLMDFVNSQAERQHLKAGRIVILPSSFTGGKRYMQQNYQDAMVMVAKFGKPDLFITFTCNPKWNEITSGLKYGETALDRPDIVATVFYMKLKQFMNDVACDKGGVLGKVEAYMSVIEFQKRGDKFFLYIFADFSLTLFTSQTLTSIKFFKN